MEEPLKVEKVEKVLKCPEARWTRVCAHPDQWGLIRTGALK
ncbi:hypothetical protein [Streptomyces sp. NPDC127033]